MTFKRPHVSFAKDAIPLGGYLGVVAFSQEWLIARNVAANAACSWVARRPQPPKRYFRKFFFVGGVHVKFHVKLRNVIQVVAGITRDSETWRRELENGWRGKTIKQRHGTRRRPLALASSRGRFSSGDVIFLRAHSCRRECGSQTARRSRAS